MSKPITLRDYVIAHTERGECGCGKCFDRGNAPDPTGHVADMVFFKVAAVNAPDADTFRRLTAEHKGEFTDCDPFDGKEYNYIELGAWIGDQGRAMQYMALGSLLGVFFLISPFSMGLVEAGDPLAVDLASAGLLAVRVLP